MFFDDTNLVTSINGEVGVVILDADDIAEGVTNKYYTEAKVSANADVAANTAKVGYTEALVTANIAADLLVAANTAKVSYDDAAAVALNTAKVSNIAPTEYTATIAIDT